MKKSKKEIEISLRYILLLILGIFFSYFYNFFFKATIYSSEFILSLFYETFIIENKIVFLNKIIEIVPACVGLSAYFLLLILNLSIPMNFKTRVKSILFSVLLLFLLNIFRIFLLAVLFIKDYTYFNILHKVFWYLLSTIFVIAIWFLTTKLFKIKSIPIYTDFRFLMSVIKRK